MPVALMYHGVLEKNALVQRSYRFARTGAAISHQLFCDHLNHLQSKGFNPVTIEGGEELMGLDAQMLTFDDGVTSAFMEVAPALEQFGWRGYFFIITDRIGKPGYMTEAQITDLHRRGHIIGTHSKSHLFNMCHLHPKQVYEEWRDSAQRLSELLGAPVVHASVPGGHYSNRVGQAASKAGLKVLFTSTPTRRVEKVNDCTVIGRYTMYARTSGARAAAIGTGGGMARLYEWITWNSKVTLRLCASPIYTFLKRNLVQK